MVRSDSALMTAKCVPASAGIQSEKLITFQPSGFGGSINSIRNFETFQRPCESKDNSDSEATRLHLGERSEIQISIHNL